MRRCWQSLFCWPCLTSHGHTQPPSFLPACHSHIADYEEIAAALAAVGAAARAVHQRLTAHPSHFVQLASPDPALVARSIRDLELNARVRPGQASCRAPFCLALPVGAILCGIVEAGPAWQLGSLVLA
jgi:hypothetical protein